ncbi:MAG: hypothetical protein QOG52_2372 [Frankiaceae bacterium]|jgi:hypothetical protein|nr:hypothetical protein [Frankiaceae bacterium]
MTLDPVRWKRTKSALQTVALTGLIPLGLTLSIARGWVIPTLVVVVFVGAAAGAIAWIGEPPDIPPPSGKSNSSYEILPVHHERIARVRRSLVQATKEGDSFDRHIRPVLADIADDRLRAAYGITITTHPDAARARLGEDLWQRLTTASGTAPTEGELRGYVKTLDQLSPPS